MDTLWHAPEYQSVTRPAKQAQHNTFAYAAATTFAYAYAAYAS